MPSSVGTILIDYRCGHEKGKPAPCQSGGLAVPDRGRARGRQADQNAASKSRLERSLVGIELNDSLTASAD